MRQFFKTFSIEKRDKIQQEQYDYLKKNCIHVPFFQWFCAKRKKKTQTWKMLKGKEIKSLKSIHLLSSEISKPYKGVVLIATSFKTKKKKKRHRKDHIKYIIQQNNYTNQYLKIIGHQMKRMEDIINQSIT